MRIFETYGNNSPITNNKIDNPYNPFSGYSKFADTKMNVDKYQILEIKKKFNDRFRNG